MSQWHRLYRINVGWTLLNSSLKLEHWRRMEFFFGADEFSRKIAHTHTHMCATGKCAQIFEKETNRCSLRTSTFIRTWIAYSQRQFYLCADCYLMSFYLFFFVCGIFFSFSTEPNESVSRLYICFAEYKHIRNRIRVFCGRSNCVSLPFYICSKSENPIKWI